LRGEVNVSKSRSSRFASCFLASLALAFVGLFLYLLTGSTDGWRFYVWYEFALGAISLAVSYWSLPRVAKESGLRWAIVGIGSLLAVDFIWKASLRLGRSFSWIEWPLMIVWIGGHIAWSIGFAAKLWPQSWE
jgi:hypothetical protein